MISTTVPKRASQLAYRSASDNETHIVLRDSEPVKISGVRREDLTDIEVEQLKRLVEVLDWKGSNLSVRRNRSHRVGRLSVGSIVITVPPAFDPEVFTDFYLYASGADLSEFSSRRTAPIAAEYRERYDIFLILLARLFIEATERVLSLGIARTYEQNVERLHLLRGRPLWTKDFGHHPAEGITCKHYPLTTENLPNQLIVAGLIAAAPILHSSSSASQWHSQLFTWRSLASSTVPSEVLFQRAEQQLTRLTAHYRTALNLARAITLGFSPTNLFAGNSGSLQTLEFSLPMLFERFLERLILSASASLGLDVRVQAQDGAAIVNGYGQLYRRIKPDLVVFDNEQPVAVIDAKYKPKYVNIPVGNGRQIPSANRVTNEDIYQICFYQTRLRLKYKTSALPLALVVAPQVSKGATQMDVKARTIRWRTAEPGADEGEYGLTLIPLPLVEVLTALKTGVSELEALSEAKELQQALVGLKSSTSSL